MKDFSRLGVEDYVRMFWRRKWYALITAVLVTAGGVFYALRLPHVYRSQTTILVQAQGISEGYVRPLESGRIEERLGGVTQELLSRSLLDGWCGDSISMVMARAVRFYWMMRWQYCGTLSM